MRSSTQVAGTVIAAVAATLAAPFAAFAYTLRESHSGAQVRWHDAERPVRVDDSLQRLAGRRQADEVVREALEAWDGVDGNPFAFETERRLHHGLGTGQRLDHVSDVSVVEQDWPLDPSYLAITFVTYDAGSGRIWDADIVLNGDQHTFATGDLAAGEYDLSSVVTHEVGHLIGLGHSEVLDATMFAETAPGETQKRSLDADDVEGMQALYAGQAMDGGGCSTTGAPTSAGGAVAWLAWGACARLLRRRREGSTRPARSDT